MRRGLFTTGVAFVLHAAIFAMVRRSDVVAAPGPAAFESVEVSVEEEVVSAAVSEANIGTPSAPARASVRSVTPATARGTGASRAVEPAAAGDAPIVAALTADQLGIGTNPFARNTFTLPAPSSEAQVRRGPLVAPMHDRDVELGLGPEGPILRTLEEATYGGLAPVRGHATFVATIDGDGGVTGLELLSSSGGEGWDETRESALVALRGKKIALRGARGAVVRIEVSSDMKLPSGATARYSAPLSRDHIGVGSANRQSNGTADVVESRTVGLFDLADIGARPRRVVHARSAGVTML